MAHLAQVASEFRIGLKLLAASFIVITILFVFFKGAGIVKNLFFPTPPPPPEQKFGKLPPVSFPPQNPLKLEYRINTLTGKLPAFPDRMKVYKVKRREPSLVALKSAREKLKAIGYSENETKISESEYAWTNPDGETIRMNISTNDFKLFSNFLSVPPQSLGGDLGQKETSYEVVSKFLENLGIEIEDLDSENSTLTYLKVENGSPRRAASLSEANLARLDLSQKDLDKHKIYYPGLTETIMYFVIMDKENFPSIVDASFTHFIPDLLTSSDYPIKTPEQAFEDLKLGNALVFLDTPQTLIDITDVSLGYYIGEENQQYFLPIVVFKGKGFTAYVQAID